MTRTRHMQHDATPCNSESPNGSCTVIGSPSRTVTGNNENSLETKRRQAFFSRRNLLTRRELSAQSLQPIIGATDTRRAAERLDLPNEAPIFSAFSVIPVSAGFLRIRCHFPLAAGTKLVQEWLVPARRRNDGTNYSAKVSRRVMRVHGADPYASWQDPRPSGGEDVLAPCGRRKVGPGTRGRARRSYSSAACPGRRRHLGEFDPLVH